MPKGSSAVAVSWKLLSGTGPCDARRCGRSSRAATTTRCTTRTRRSASRRGEDARAARCASSPTTTCPPYRVRSNGVRTTPAPDWYRNFLYAEEKARGLDFSEDLASPGTVPLRSRRGRGRLARRRRGARGACSATGRRRGGARVAALVGAPPARAASPDRLDRAADAYLVRRGAGWTIVAGYPWFTDWGRDTFIALRGLCLATGRLAEAEGILLEWAGAVSEGMLPNFFPGRGTRARVQLGGRVALVRRRRLRVLRGHGGRGPAPSRRSVRAKLAGRDRGDPRGLLGGHALRDPRRRRRPPRRGPARRAADVDGREGRRLGRDAADRQAGRGPGALDERALRSRRASRSAWRDAPRSRRSRRSRSASGTRRAAFSTTSSIAITSPGRPTPPSGRTRSSPSAACRFPLARGRAGPADRRRRRGAARDAARTALARAGRPGLRRTVRGRPAAARRRVPPGDRLALSRRRLRGRLGAGARRHRRREGGGPRGASSRRSGLISTRRASATSPRSPTAMRPTRRAAAPSRPGRSGSSSASTGWSSPSRESRPPTADRTARKRRSHFPHPTAPNECPERRALTPQSFRGP